jgi:o-succinylbenzoate synthase
VIRVARTAVRREGRSAIVNLNGERGGVGLGEAAPLEGRSRESLADSEAAISTVLASLDTIDDDADARSAVARALEPHARVLGPAPSARFALETALFALIAERRGLSVAEVLGGPRPYAAIALNGLTRMSAATGSADLVAACRTLLEQGFAAIKIKLPKEGDDATFDRARRALAGLREAMPELELRVDVNAGWSPSVAVARLAALEPLRLRYVEQPVAPADVACLHGSRVPWAADESLERPDVDAAALLGIGRCAAFVLKPTCVGGLLRARELAEVALARGADVVVTHAFEGPIARAAARQLALSFSRPPLACGLAPAETARG